MRASFLTPLAVCLVVLGCSSDESVVCERLAECDLLPEGLNESECAEQAVRQVPEDRLSDCAECVEDTDCKKIQDACKTFCAPGD